MASAVKKTQEVCFQVWVILRHCSTRAIVINTVIASVGHERDTPWVKKIFWKSMEILCQHQHLQGEYSCTVYLMLHFSVFIIAVFGTSFFTTCPEYPGGDTLNTLPVLPPGSLPHPLSSAIDAIRKMVMHVHM